MVGSRTGSRSFFRVTPERDDTTYELCFGEIPLSTW